MFLRIWSPSPSSTTWVVPPRWSSSPTWWSNPANAARSPPPRGSAAHSPGAAQEPHSTVCHPRVPPTPATASPELVHTHSKHPHRLGKEKKRCSPSRSYKRIGSIRREDLSNTASLTRSKPSGRFSNRLVSHVWCFHVPEELVPQLLRNVGI